MKSFLLKFCLWLRLRKNQMAGALLQRVIQVANKDLQKFQTYAEVEKLTRDWSSERRTLERRLALETDRQLLALDRSYRAALWNAKRGLGW